MVKYEKSSGRRYRTFRPVSTKDSAKVGLSLTAVEYAVVWVIPQRTPPLDSLVD